MSLHTKRCYHRKRRCGAPVVSQEESHPFNVSSIGKCDICERIGVEVCNSVIYECDIPEWNGTAMKLCRVCFELNEMPFTIDV